MERLMSRESPKDNRRSTSRQKLVVESHRFSHRPPEPVPDVAELMDEWFFGSGNVKTNQNKNLTTSAGAIMDDHQEVVEVLEDSPRNSNSRMTQEWLEEAKRIVAESPTRYDSPSRLVGSPRFASSGPSDLDRRDPLSRSARRSANHSRNKSESFEGQGIGEPDSPQWFANNLGHRQTLADHFKHSNSKEEEQPLDPTIKGKPPRLPVRKSRFQDVPATTQSVGSPTMPRKSFRSSSSGQLDDHQLLSPPKSLTDPAHRRSLSSSTFYEDKVLSPPRRLVESIQRRSISSSTCSVDKIPPRQDSKGRSLQEEDLNMFLKEQRSKMYGISSGEIHVKAKIVLSGSSNSTSSMVAAICYAWLLDRRIKDNKEDRMDGAVVIPVMNMRRGRMWKQKQVAWLFHNIGVDANSLLFTDEASVNFTFSNFLFKSD
ncbi:hypothetical protein Sjap_023477 [Stephania japonica]|uniref:Uncharacterized protein n=1 Tax=Stephania japonica TaxID=461633 RepID=A0AAP0HP96_9MAGN